MPNWCNNNVTISHSDPVKIEALAEAVREGKFCDHVKPVPPSLHIVAGRVGDDTDPKQIALEAQEKANLETHGYSTWYDFCVNEWGTKWDVEAYQGENVKVQDGVLDFGFDSAWSPPLGIYESLIDQGFSVVAYYYESGMSFCGVWDEGYDDCFQIEGTWEQVKDEIPEALDEMFGISECMREYEEDNREDEELYLWVKEGVAEKDANE